MYILVNMDDDFYVPSYRWDRIGVAYSLLLINNLDTLYFNDCIFSFFFRQISAWCYSIQFI